MREESCHCPIKAGLDNICHLLKERTCCVGKCRLVYETRLSPKRATAMAVYTREESMHEILRLTPDVSKTDSERASEAAKSRDAVAMTTE